MKGADHEEKSHGSQSQRATIRAAMSRATEHPHVVRGPADEPYIEGTRIPVRAVVELWRISVKAEDIPTHLPHINLAQVFDALSYYADHQSEIDRFIEINRVSDHDVHPSTRE
jgi:uncharacterized protein (DUF433 family)